jgi:hypothetical protein
VGSGRDLVVLLAVVRRLSACENNAGEWGKFVIKRVRGGILVVEKLFFVAHDIDPRGCSARHVAGLFFEWLVLLLVC